MRKILLGFALWLAASCAQAQIAPSPADVGISKGTPTDVFKLKGHDGIWTPFGSIDSTTHIFTPVGGGGGGSLTVTDGTHSVSGTTSLTFSGATVSGATPNATATISGGGGGAGATLFANHSALLSGATSAMGMVTQQGFYNPGDGGDATYSWNATSVCPTGPYGTSGTTADQLSCILPSGQSSATPGRFLMNFGTALSARAFGLQPGLGAAFDNSPLLPPLMAAVGPPGLGQGMDINFTPNLGQIYTSYYFSQPFEITHGTSITCSNSTSVNNFAGKVEFVFPAGVSGLIQENFRLSASGSGDFGSTVQGCNIGALGRFGSPNAAGNADPGASVLNHLSGGVPVAWSGAAPDLAVGDGIVVVGSVTPINGNILVKAPSGGGGAFVSALSGTSGNQNVTLPAGYVIGPQAPAFGSPSSSANVWRLPANEKYQVAATIHSSNADITGGRRPLKVGAWVWSEAFLFGTVMLQENNQVIASPLPTVAAAGSGYAGTSGTMTWAGSGCFVPPVLNVSASGGITAVTGVANAGTCNGAWPPNTATTWTPGGGLSGGSGARFNLSFVNHAVMATMAASSQPAPALETGNFNLWAMNAGLTRREGGNTRGVLMENFPIGLEAYCDSGTNLSTGCSNSQDQGDTIKGGFIGRYVTGSDCAPSTAIGNVYGENPIADVVDTCTLTNLYLDDNQNSPENNFGKYAALSSCSFEGAVFVGGYMSSNTATDGYCLGTDSNGSLNIGWPTKPLNILNQSRSLGIGVGVPGTALVTGNGGMVGQFTFIGYLNSPAGLSGSAKFQTASAPVTAGNSVVTINAWFSQLAPGMTVLDTTHPTAIPGSTTVTAINPGATQVTLSNPVAAPGISTNDQIVFNSPAPACISVVGGNDLLFGMSANCDGGGSPYDFNMTFSQSIVAWTMNNLWIPTPGYKGYNSGADLVLPHGISLGANGGSWSLGHERQFDIDDNPLGNSNDNRLPGDVRFITNPLPGGNWGWAWTPVFTTSFSANVVAGTTTSVAVAGCPSPALPAGTPIDSAFVGNLAHVGNLSTCVGTTLTFQSAALTNATSGWSAEFLQSRPAAPIANDAAGSSWNLGSYLRLAPVALASLPTSCVTGTFAVINNGVASPTYNAGVGSTTGSSNDPVFCSNNAATPNNWVYH